MNTNLKKVLAVFAVFALVATGAASAATYQLNAEADAHPDTYFQENHLTVESHNQSTMDWLEYEGDNGKIKTVAAHVNGTASGAKVSYLPTHLEDADLLQYPRQSGEENNTISWADANAWTSTTGVVAGWAAFVVLLVVATGRSSVRGRKHWILVGSLGGRTGLLALEVIRPGVVWSALSSGLRKVVPLAGLAAIALVGYSTYSWWKKRKAEASTPETKVTFDLNQE